MGTEGQKKSPVGTESRHHGKDAIMALTDVKCRGTKPGKTRQKLSDGGGLQLWIQPNGARLWQLIYRYQGKQAQMALGPLSSSIPPRRSDKAGRRQSENQVGYRSCGGEASRGNNRTGAWRHF